MSRPARAPCRRASRTSSRSSPTNSPSFAPKPYASGFARGRPHRWDADARPDLQVVAGWLPALRARPPRPCDHEVRLEVASVAECVDEYRTLSQDLLEDLPETTERPGPTSSLDACEEVGAFYRILVDGEPAGFVAARRGSYRTVDGWEVVEEILSRRFRGQGLAVPMHQVLLRTLDIERHPVVHGLIEASNGPSLGAATGAGRRVVEQGFFLPLPHGG